MRTETGSARKNFSCTPGVENEKCWRNNKNHFHKNAVVKRWC